MCLLTRSNFVNFLGTKLILLAVNLARSSQIPQIVFLSFKNINFEVVRTRIPNIKNVKKITNFLQSELGISTAAISLAQKVQ